MKRFYRLLGIILLAVLGQQSGYTAKFYSVNSLYGISLREVNSVCSDDHGFIWASSKFGVIRLSDKNYKIYQLPYANTNIVTIKLLFRDSSLFVFTNNGQLFRYNRISDRFELIDNLRRLDANKYIYVKNVDYEAGCFWLATNRGLLKYANGDLTIVDSLDCLGIVRHASNQLLYMNSLGILVCDLATSKTQKLHLGGDFKDFNFTVTYFDEAKQRLWLGDKSRGLFYYDLSNHQFKRIVHPIFAQQPILAIERNSNQTMLIGIDGNGICEIDDDGIGILNHYRNLTDDMTSLPGNGVYDIFCDANNRVWIGTYSGGLSYYDQAIPLVDHFAHVFNDRNSLGNNDVNDVLEDKYGKLWCATNSGISIYDPKLNEWNHIYHDKNSSVVFLSLCEDDQGRIWAGSYASGLYVLDVFSGRELIHYSKEKNNSPLANDYVFDLYKDQKGIIWIGGASGLLSSFNPLTNQFIAYNHEPINCFFGLSEDELLLGVTYGLLLFNKKTTKIDVLHFGVSVQSILCIGDVIWVGTSGDGLLKYDLNNRNITKFSTQDGLVSNYISSVALFGDFLWLGTEGGVCRFDFKEESFVSYPSIFSLSRYSFNNGAQYTTRNGLLAWGTNNGVVIFSPHLINQNPSRGKIFFQDLMLAGTSVRDLSNYLLTQPIDSLTSIRVEHYQNSLMLELLSLNADGGSKFSWQLEGVDNEWSQPSDNRMVTYTNIPAGNYVLKVRMYDSALSHVIDERMLAIEVVPPFWKTWWFWVLVYVVLLGLAVLVFIYYLKSIRQKHTEEKVRFFTNTAHDIRTSLTLIKAPVEALNREPHLTKEGRHYLGLAIEQARRLSSVVTQLMDFQKVDIGKEQLTFVMVDVVGLLSRRISMFDSLAQSRHIQLVFTPSQSQFLTGIDESKMERVVDNLLSNAIKYSREHSKVEISLTTTEQTWVLVVTDQGIGMSKAIQRRLFKEFFRGENAINSKIVGSGIGLLLVKNYVAMHQGVVSCVSRENEGSAFRVEIPYRQVAQMSLPDDQVSKSEALIEPSFEFTNQTGSEEVEAEPEMKILIVEDNDDLLLFMQSALSHDFKVYTAVNGVEAWDQIGRYMPDLVVSDIMMPEMDGFDLCEKIKSTYETSHIPVVLLTALSEKTEQLRGLGLGADDYLTKPFDITLLIGRIKTIILNRQLVRDRALKVLKGDTVEPIMANELNDKFMKRMLEVIKENLSNTQFTKEEFATAMNVSSSLLYKKVKTLTKLPPSEFIKMVRLDTSIEMLKTRKYTVTEVSEMCGFATVGYFSTVFKKHYGKSPTDVIE